MEIGCGLKALDKTLLRKRNEQNARKERPDALQKLIVDVLKVNPSASWKKVLREIEKRQGQGVIVSFPDDDSIECRTYADKGKKVKVRG